MAWGRLGGSVQIGTTASRFGAALARVDRLLYVGAPGLMRSDGARTGGVVVVDLYDPAHIVDVWYG